MGGLDPLKIYVAAASKLRQIQGRLSGPCRPHTREMGSLQASVMYYDPFNKLKYPHFLLVTLTPRMGMMQPRPNYGKLGMASLGHEACIPVISYHLIMPRNFDGFFNLRHFYVFWLYMGGLDPLKIYVAAASKLRQI